MKKIYYMIGVAAMLLSACVKNTLYRTPHPDRGAVTISLTGLAATDDYVMDIDGQTADIDGSPFTCPWLLAPGAHSLVVYNRAEGFTFDGRTARVNAPGGMSRADGASVIPLPGYLKTACREMTVAADDTLRVSPTPQQRVRDLQLELEVTQGRPELIQSVTATLGGIAGAFDMEANRPSANLSPRSLPLPAKAASSRPTCACWVRWEPCRPWCWTSYLWTADAHSARRST